MTPLDEFAKDVSSSRRRGRPKSGGASPSPSGSSGSHVSPNVEQDVQGEESDEFGDPPGSPNPTGNNVSPVD